MTRPTQRTAELAAIHLRAKRLGMDTHDRDPGSDYRAMLWTIARVHSAAELDEAGRHKVLDHLARVSGARGSRITPADARRPLMRKIQAQLKALGKDDAYADAIARHMFRVERYAWLDPGQLHKLVAALAIHAKRRQARRIQRKKLGLGGPERN